MPKVSTGRVTAILSFLLLLVGATFCFDTLRQDILSGRYFSNPEELRYEAIFLASYILIILFLLRYGYYLAVNRVNWKNVKDDFLYLLSKKYFNKFQWLLNMLLFWSALLGFIYSLTISTMKGSL